MKPPFCPFIPIIQKKRLKTLTQKLLIQWPLVACQTFLVSFFAQKRFFRGKIERKTKEQRNVWQIKKNRKLGRFCRFEGVFSGQKRKTKHPRGGVCVK